MGLKCSVLGHNYGDETVERDREEQGSEVVITIQEIEICARCGDERVVSENKEVTTIATPDEPDESGPADGGGDEVDWSDEEDELGNSVVGSDDLGDASSTTSSAGDPAPPVDQNEGVEILDAEADHPVDDELADPSIEDDGFATDEEVGEPTDGTGEHRSSNLRSSSTHDADENDASTHEDAVIMDEGEDGRAPGEWPEEPADAGDASNWSPDEPFDGEETITAPDAGTDRNAALTVPDGNFQCPNCGFSTAVESSSLRAGDFCPDCHRGSLVHDAGDETRKE